MNEAIKTELAQVTTLMKANKLEQAMSQLKQLIEQYPKNEVIRGLLASLYFQIGMVEESIEHYQYILQKNPANALAAFQLGMAYYMTEQFEKAINAWEPLCQLKEDFMARFHSGLAYQQLGNETQAKQLFDAAYQSMPTDHALYPQLVQIITDLSA